MEGFFEFIEESSLLDIPLWEGPLLGVGANMGNPYHPKTASNFN